MKSEAALKKRKQINSEYDSRNTKPVVLAVPDPKDKESETKIRLTKV